MTPVPVHKHAKLWVEALPHQQLEKLLLRATLIHTLLPYKLDLLVQVWVVVKHDTAQRSTLSEVEGVAWHGTAQHTSVWV